VQLESSEIEKVINFCSIVRCKVLKLLYFVLKPEQSMMSACACRKIVGKEREKKSISGDTKRTFPYNV
jgi:hypothetical protein